MSFSDQLDKDLSEGIELEDCLRRFSGWVDAWIAGHQHWCQRIELRIQRLESTLQVDKQNLDEVDTSVRQSWEALDRRLKSLEQRVKQLDARTAGSVVCR